MDDLGIREIEYYDFSVRLHEAASAWRLPIEGQIEMTFRCNLRCVHCYVVEDRTKQELTFHEVADIIDQVYRAGCLWLSLTGGEPLLREDFLEVYWYAKKKGLVLTILTNGTLMTPETVRFLREAPPFSIEMTLNGVTRETYESISRVPGSFEKAMEGIARIRENRLPLRIKTKATSLNYAELDRIKGFVESLGVPFDLNPILYPRIDGSLEPCRFRLSPDQVIALDRLFPEENEEEEGGTRPGSLSPSNNLFRCAAGVTSFYVSPYGELVFCTYMRKPSFDLRKGPFRTGFSTLYPEIRSAKYRTHSSCRECRTFHLCSQCAAGAMLECGHPENPTAYFCELAQKRKGERVRWDG